MFGRIRCQIWQIVAGVDPVHRGARLEPIVREGAQCEAAHLLIDQIATLAGIATINGGSLDDRAATWAMPLRACEGTWIPGDVFPNAHVPLDAPDVPEHQPGSARQALAGREQVVALHDLPVARLPRSAQSWPATSVAVMIPAATLMVVQS
ncbi:MAG TPA: hypothetical protein VFT22_08070 [Kofleriaceae bacterium]|nr:hypothetical protein [Kofleriaceae bacterium]